MSEERPPLPAPAEDAEDEEPPELAAPTPPATPPTWGDRLRALVQRESLLRLAGRTLPLPLLVLLIAADGPAKPALKVLGALLFTPLILLPSLAELHGELSPRSTQRLFAEALLASLLGVCVCSAQLLYLGELFRSGDVQKALQQAASLLEFDPWLLRVLATLALSVATPIAAAATLRARSSGEPLWRRTLVAALSSLLCGFLAWHAFPPWEGEPVHSGKLGSILEFTVGFAIGSLCAALVIAAWSAAVDWLARRVFRERGRLT